MNLNTYTTAEEVLDAVWGVVEFAAFAARPTVDSVGIFGNQPLTIAITWGHIQPVELLIAAGASIGARNEGGDTALHHALQMGHFAIARRLIQLGADQMIRNEEGKLPRDICWEGEWEGLGLIGKEEQ